MYQVFGDNRLDFGDIFNESGAGLRAAIQGAAAIGAEIGPVFLTMINALRCFPPRAFVANRSDEPFVGVLRASASDKMRAVVAKRMSEACPWLELGQFGRLFVGVNRLRCNSDAATMSIWNRRSQKLTTNAA